MTMGETLAVAIATKKRREKKIKILGSAFSYTPW